MQKIRQRTSVITELCTTHNSLRVFEFDSTLVQPNQLFYRQEKNLTSSPFKIMSDFKKLNNISVSCLLSVQQCGLLAASCSRPQLPTYLLKVSQCKTLSYKSRQTDSLGWKNILINSSSNTTK